MKVRGEMSPWNFARDAENETPEFRRFFVLLIVGLLIILAGITIMVVASALYGGGGSISYGALIYIGPFPIVIGTGSEAKWTVSFAIVLGILSIVMLILMRKSRGEKRSG
jgi:uncharacterized membrane protein